MRSRTVLNKYTVPEPRDTATNGPSPTILNIGHRFRAIARQSFSVISDIVLTLRMGASVPRRRTHGQPESKSPHRIRFARSTPIRRTFLTDLNAVRQEMLVGWVQFVFVAVMAEGRIVHFSCGNRRLFGAWHTISLSRRPRLWKTCVLSARCNRRLLLRRAGRAVACGDLEHR